MRVLIRRSAGATVGVFVALMPGIAAAHPGDFYTQRANAVKACVARFDGCRYQSHSDGDSGSHQRFFLFERDSTNGARKCYQQYVLNHDNVVTDDLFMGCS